MAIASTQSSAEAKARLSNQGVGASTGGDQQPISSAAFKADIVPHHNLTAAWETLGSKRRRHFTPEQG